MRKIISIILLLVLCLGLFSGCHGSRGLDAFVIPEEFDTSRDYEITFWAKNDTSKPRPTSTKKPLPILKRFIPMSP